MYTLRPDITKDFILTRLSQEQIMEKYLQVRVELHKRITSPLRQDKNPSCGFFYTKQGDLLFKDFATGYVAGCFKLVMEKFNLSYNETLSLIVEDFGLYTDNPVPRIEYITPEEMHKEHTAIQIKRRDFEEVDRLYWTSFGVSKDTLRMFHVYPVSNVWVNGKIVYNFQKSDVAYAYWFGGGDYKIYFPFRKGSRFICNCTVVQGEHIPRDYSKGTIITKSMKDVLVLHEFGITAVAPQSESVYPDPEWIEGIKSKSEFVYSLYDFDRAGIKMANYMRKKFDISPLFLTNGRFATTNYGAKDISDLVKLHGKSYVASTISWLLDEYHNH